MRCGVCTFHPKIKFIFISSHSQSRLSSCKHFILFQSLWRSLYHVYVHLKVWVYKFGIIEHNKLFNLTFLILVDCSCCCCCWLIYFYNIKGMPSITHLIYLFLAWLTQINELIRASKRAKNVAVTGRTTSTIYRLDHIECIKLYFFMAGIYYVGERN